MSIASWALRYVASFPNINVILSGMSNEENVADNLATFTHFEPLSDAEQQVVKKVVKAVKARVKNGCTGCRYCMPCPFGVDIPRNFHLWNEHAMYGNDGATRWNYFTQMKEENRADQCKKCGACEKMCPQSIPIRENLAQLVDYMNALK